MKGFKTTLRMLAAAAGLAGAMGMAGQAAAQSGGDTAFQITPYAWATGLGGDLTVGAQTVAIDKSFSDLIKDLDGAFFVSAFGRYDRLVFLGDLSWSSSSRAGILPSPPAPLPLPAEGKLRQTSLTLAAGYRISETPGATVDLLGGVRHWRVRAQADVPALGFSATRRDSFTDPIVGARINAAIAPNWSTVLYADLGGFGVGSDFTGQIVATVNYSVSDNLFISAGYRHMHVDYRTGGLRVDARMSGPLLGATWRF